LLNSSISTLSGEQLTNTRQIERIDNSFFIDLAFWLPKYM